jgi:hypothetical protein
MDGPEIFATLGDDLRRVAGDVRKRGLRQTIDREFASLDAFYLTERERAHLAKTAWIARPILRLWWFILSLLLKLTPARRIVLAAGLVLLFMFRTGVIAIGHVRIEIPWTAFGGVLVLLVLMLELKDKRHARSELEAGRAVQLALMPQASPVIPGWDAWLYTAPANDVGGDLVDYIRPDDTRHVVALGDVSGKALPAALLSVKLQATLRALAPRSADLGALGSAVNEIFVRDGLPSRFASLAYLEFTSDSDSVHVLNAGHPPPLVVRRGRVVPMNRGSIVLGLMPGSTFGEDVIDLAPGDAVVIYSDGVTEGMNEAEDFFGDERLVAVVEASADLPAEQLGRAVLATLKDFVGEAVQSDDVSLIVLKRTAAA